MHVLSLCICYWKASDRNRSQLCSGSSEKQVCLPVSANRESANVYEVTEVISGGNVCLVSQTHWSGLKQKHVMFHLFLSFFVFLSRFLSAECFSAFVLVQRCSVVESTSWAKLEFSCQSKWYFMRILFTLCRSCAAFLICVTSENFKSLCCVFQLLTLSSVMKFRISRVCVCAPFIQHSNSWKNWIFSVTMRRIQLSPCWLM